MSSRTCCAVVGLGLPERLALGAAMGTPLAAMSARAAALSGMAQGVGYFVAAAAPLVVGVLHEYTGDWHAVSVFMVLLMGGTLWSGLLAGRARLIQ